jgi:hypothetical protein
MALRVVRQKVSASAVIERVATDLNFFYPALPREQPEDPALTRESGGVRI